MLVVVVAGHELESYRVFWHGYMSFVCRYGDTSIVFRVDTIHLEGEWILYVYHFFSS
jgi:hypothetical protein